MGEDKVNYILNTLLISLGFQEWSGILRTAHSLGLAFRHLVYLQAVVLTIGFPYPGFT